MLGLITSLLLIASQASAMQTASPSIKTLMGPLRAVSISRTLDGHRELWGVTSRGRIYNCRLPCDGRNNKLTRVNGSLRRIASNDYEVWGTNRSHRIFRCTKPCKLGQWERVEGRLRHIAVGPNAVWGVNQYEDVFMTTASPGAKVSWAKVGGKEFKDISVGEDGTVWAVRNENEIVRYQPITGNWVTVPGSARKISVGRKFIFAVGSAGDLRKCRRPCFKGNWHKIEAGGHKIKSVSAQYSGSRKLYAVTEKGDVLRIKFRSSKLKRCRDRIRQLLEKDPQMSSGAPVIAQSQRYPAYPAQANNWNAWWQSYLPGILPYNLPNAPVHP